MSSHAATSAASAPSCPRCGRAIPAAAPLGACPHCLLAAGLPSAFGAPAPEGPPPPSPAELAPEFPALEIVDLLGRGGMGAVYKARQRDLDRLVALKILRPGLDTDPGFAGRFAREARALAGLNHPGIVTLYEFGRTSAGRYFILMEFVDGVNLRGLLSAGRLSPREALAIVPPLCDALQYAHDRGLVHRDIKPENILVDRLGRVKIADFGIARLASAGSSASSIAAETEIAGTPAYMAPEQKERPGAVDHRADIYALGVVLYQMLTGELPSAGQLQSPSRRVHIDVRLDEIVLRALEKDPALRYAAASEFKTSVETFARSGAPGIDAGAPISRWHDFEYKSRRILFGLPLLHVVQGFDPATGRARVARGIVAIGGQARGIFAFGGVAVGVFAFGGLSLGLFAYGGLVAGLLTLGGIGLGLLGSFSGFAIAPVALGGMSVGWYAFGGLGFGRFVLSATQSDPAARRFFEPWAEPLVLHAMWWNIVLCVLCLLVSSGLPWLLRRRLSRASTATRPPAPAMSGVLPLRPASILVLLLISFCGLLGFAAKEFPQQVAVHFDLSGRPDAWAERGVALLLLLVAGVGVPLFLVVLFATLRFLPNHLLNLPHRDFWLAPKRAAATHARLHRAGFWFASLAALFFCGIQVLSQWAHLRGPVRLPMAALWLWASLFVIATLATALALHRGFRHPERAANPPPPVAPSRLARLAAPWLLIFLLFATVLVPINTAVTILRAHQTTLRSSIPPHQTTTKPTIPAHPTGVEAKFSVSPPTKLSLHTLLPVSRSAVSLLASCEFRDRASAKDWRAAKDKPRLLLIDVRADSIFIADEVLIPIPPDQGVIWTRTGDTFTRHTGPSAATVAELTRLLALAPTESESRITLPRARPLAYDFDAEKFVEYSPTPRSPHGILHSPYWHQEQGTDAFADSSSHRHGVLLLGAKSIEVAAGAWDMPSDELARRYENFVHSEGGLTTFLAAPAIGENLTSHVYRSPQGALVLLQLLGSADSGDVELRYRKLTRVLIGGTGHPEADHLHPTAKRTVLVTDRRSSPPRAFSPDNALPVADAAVALLKSSHSREQITPDAWSAAEAKPHVRLDRRDADADLPEALLIPLPLGSGPILSIEPNGPTRHSHLPPPAIIALMRALSPTIPFESPFRFGPEKEITLPYNGTLAYDFDEDRFVEFRPGLKPEARPPNGVLPASQWLFEQGGEVFADHLAPSHVSFIGTSRHGTRTSLTYIPGDTQPMSADEAFLHSDATGGGEVTVYAISVDTACICRTREGRLFLVEILGVVDGGIKLRYKAIVPAVLTPDPNP